MKTIRTIDELKSERAKITSSLGFVPTMGCLHQGHLSLVRQSGLENTATVVSLFINPFQFGPNEDYEAYPRAEQRDLEMLAEAGVDIAFIPSPSQIYPPGFDTWVLVGNLAEKLEGRFRPGHFRGVATACNILFNIVAPHHVYMGQKDAQQLVVVKKMVKDLNMNLTIQAVPTVRESDGLAMSSRNTYLTSAERQAAPVLYRALCLAGQMWSNSVNKAGDIIAAMSELICREPLAQIEYISVNDTQTLEDIEIISTPVLVSLAVRIGSTRLIDNITLEWHPGCFPG